jgi:proline dehydrogenase
MLDMEDFSVVQKTLDLRARMAQAGYPTGITIQAYLYRSEQDARDLVESGAAAIRLVKGAFAESREHAWTSRADINREFLGRRLSCCPQRPRPTVFIRSSRLMTRK